MRKIFEKALVTAKDRYARSPFATFLLWWRDELLGVLPPKWRDRLSAAPAQIVLGRVGSDWVVARVRGNRIDAQQAVQMSNPGDVQHVIARLSAIDDQPAERRVLALNAEQVLRKRLTLPLAAEENLAQVLGFEMDRQTPFKAEQVYFDWQIYKRDPTARSMVVDLVAVPKPVLEEVLTELAPAQFNLDAVDLSAARGDIRFEHLLGFNLLPLGKRGASHDPQARMRWILSGALLGLVILVMYQSLQAREIALEALRERVGETQLAARQTADLAKQVREAIAGANFLAERKHKQPETIKVLLELTQLVPQDTWLERISFVGKTVQLQGQSAAADKLISILQNATYVGNPQFQGVIQPDPSSGKERFSLQIDLKEEAPSVPKPSPTLAQREP